LGNFDQLNLKFWVNQQASLTHKLFTAE